MLRRLRENGPIVLVPAIWSFVTAAHLGYVTPRTFLVGNVVMEAIFVVFTVASWRDMRDGVLLAWKYVLVGGGAVNLLGIAGLAVTPVNTTLLSVTVTVWMFLPAAALAYTGRNVVEAPRVYLIGGALSVFGGMIYLAAPALPPVIAPVLLGLTFVNVGQTAGIVNAVYQY